MHRASRVHQMCSSPQWGQREVVMESCCNASKSSRSAWIPVERWPPCSRTFYNNYAHGFTVRKDPPQRDECAVMSALPSTF